MACKEELGHTINSSQGMQDSLDTRRESTVTRWSPTPTEPYLAAQDLRWDVLGVQEAPCVTPTASAPMEDVPLTPPGSLNMSDKSRLSVGPICRICHEGEAAGTLLRPCRCSGTMGSVHRDCLERWLNMATSEVCELCGHSYQLHYITRPFWQFLIKCDNNEARRALKMDLVCLLVLTPLALCSVYLCCVSAIQYVNQKQVSFSVFTDEPSRLYKSRKRLEQADLKREHLESTGWEAMLLVTVAIVLIFIYTCWASLTIKYHVGAWRQWRVVHQEAALTYNTLSPPSHITARTQNPSSAQDSECPIEPNTEHPHDAVDSRLVSPS